MANGNSLTNLPDPKDQKERMSVSPSPSSSASPGKGGKKKKNNNNKGKSNSRSRGKSKSKSKSRSPQPEKIEMKYVKSTYLAPIQNITKGTTVEELYKEMAEWSQIKLENLQIAKILDKGRKHSRDPKIVNFAEKDVKMKLKRIPIDTKDDILIWDKNEGDLAEQELKRRRECIKLTVWVCIKGGNGGDHDSDYPQSIHINPKETLHDLFDQLKEQLTDEQKKIIEGEGRFRDIDTHKIYRNHDCTLKKLQIKRNHSLRFEKETIPKDNEIVIRFRIKNSEYKHANRSPEHELYISKDERVSMLKAMMASKFEVEAASYEVRKARSNWTLGQKCEGKSFEYVKQCKFDKTQIVILAQTIDKTKRSLDIYCQTQIIDNRKVFKIPKILLLDDNENGVIIEEEKKEESISSPESSSVINKGMNVVKDVVNVLQRPIGSRASLKSPASAEDGDITMEENMDNKDNKDDTDAKENDIDNNQLIPPKDDGMDVYPENSEILCTLVVDKSFNGLQIKKAFRECKELNLNTRLKSDIELTYFTMSMSKKAKNQSRMRWEIMNQSWCHKGIQNANPRGRVIAEFHNEPFKDDIYRRDQESKILLFIYKMCANYNNSEHATYGSRYRITVTVKQRTKLDALKQTIINKCDWKSSLKASNIMLAVRNIDSHKWTVITSKLTQKKSTNKKGHKRAAKRSPPKEKIVQQKLFDRDIIAVMDVSHLTNQEKEDIVENPVCFETEFDKYYYLKYLRQQQEKEDDESDDGDAVPLLINFQNDSQEDNDNNDKNQEDK